MSKADDIGRDIAALEPRLDKLRERIESDFYGWGAERDLAQERLDAGVAHVADARALAAELRDQDERIEKKTEEVEGQAATIERLDKLAKELAEEFGSEPD